jgi:hypothetical protein
MCGFPTTVKKLFELSRIEHGLRDRVFRTGFDFPIEATQLFLRIDRYRVDADANREARRRADRVAAGSRPRFKLLTRFVRPIESTSNTGVASGYGPIFGGSPVTTSRLRNPIAEAPSRVAQHPEQVAVAARVVDHGLDADLLLDEQRRHQRAHAALRARPSGTFTASTPAFLRRPVSLSMRVASVPRGGTISTDVTNFPSRELCAQRERSANGTGSRRRWAEVG